MATLSVRSAAAQDRCAAADSRIACRTAQGQWRWPARIPEFDLIEVSESALTERFLQLLPERAGANAYAVVFPALVMLPVLNANPRFVPHVDIEASPQLRSLGSLCLAS